MAKIILTGDRPTGKLHIGHYVGSLRNRVLLQNSGEYDEIYIMIADAQALTDNFDNPDKVRENILEVALDYLACGIDPSKTTIFIQSEISQLTELTFYYMNLVSVSRLQRNPTVKAEIKMRGFDASIPVGFQCYPISQAADITAFKATTVPAGEDQMPMIEQTQEIVHKFNSIYGETLVEPKILLPQNCACLRLPGTDGKAKMSKSLGNCIYLSDDEETIKKKVMSMYTDPDHIKVSDPGKIEGNCVFTYLDAFCKPEHFEKYLPEYENLDALKAHYQRGGLGDVKVKRFLNSVMQEELAPIRERRLEWQAKLPEVVKILEEGTKKAYATAEKTLDEVKALPMGNGTVQDAVTDRSGITGEKMELDGYMTVEGVCTAVYNHMNRNGLCTIVAFNKEVNEQLAKQIAMQIAAMNPIAIDEDGVSEEVKQKEIEVAIEKTKAEQVQKAVEAALKKAGINPAHVDSEDHMESNMSKGWITAEDVAKAKEIIATVSAEKAAHLPEQMIQNIAKGRLGKFLKEVCLLNQEDIMDGKKTVREVLKEADPELKVVDFKRFTLRAE